MSHKEWLQARKSGIGGSDAASIAGLNKWSSPLKVFMDKTETLNEVSEQPISEAAEWGNIHEPSIRKKFKENHPELRVQQSHFMWQHPKYKFMLANVDGLVFDPNRGWGVLEIKTASEWLNGEWGEEQAPENYVIQIQHYLAVLGLNYGWFAVLIGGNKYREFFIERDNSLIEPLIELEKDFWENHVIQNIPPEPDGSDSSAEILLSLHPASSALPTDEILELEDSTVDLINELDQIKKQEKELAKRKKEIEQTLQKKLGDYQVGAVEDRTVSWKTSRGFNEQELAKAKPELYEQFAVTALDKTAFKKAYPKIYNEFMLPTGKRTFSVKEEEVLYVV